MMNSVIEIDDDTNMRLHELAEREDESVSELIAEAVYVLDDQHFWSEIDAAISVAADAVVSQLENEEEEVCSSSAC